MSTPITTTQETLHQMAGEVVGRTTLVVDTSVLVADPGALHAFDGHDLVIPLTVIEELDRLKARPDQAGANARQVVRLLEELRLAAGGSLSTPVLVSSDSDSTVRIEPNGLRLDELDAFHLDRTEADHRILAAALGLSHDGRPVEVVSCDGAMRLKADTLGLKASDYVFNNAPFTTGEMPGWAEVEVSEELVDAVHAAKVVKDLDTWDADALAGVEVNEFALLRSGTKSALVRRHSDRLHKLAESRSKPAVWGVRSRNKEQQFALELLTDETVSVVALSGRAGTGKTLLAIAAALEQTMEHEPTYDRVMILRPMFAIGKQDIGFLPGEVEDKVAPWFDAVVDAMVALSTQPLEYTKARDLLALWVEQGKMTMEPVTFLRGRSLQRTLVILDEAQNLEVAEMKTVLTRLGQGSKIVVCGDPDQCDNPFTSPTANGITSLVAGFRGEDLFGHVALTACERSRIADLAADKL